MTENEAIAVRFIENIKNHAMVTLEHIAKEEPNVSPLVYKGREKKADTILAMVEELQQYRALEKRLAEMFGVALSLEDIIDELERQLKEPGSPHPVNAKILTYEDAADWDAYRAIGTVEECRAAVEQLENERKFLEHAYDKDLGKEKARSYAHAIKIVEGGGVDGN